MFRVTPMLLSLYIALATLVILALISFPLVMRRGSTMFTTTMNRWLSFLRPQAPESAAFRAYTGDEEVKMVLVVRRDLKMTSGKVAAQCAHAAVALVEEMHDLDCIRRQEEDNRRAIRVRNRKAATTTRTMSSGASASSSSTEEAGVVAASVPSQKRDWLGWYDAWAGGGWAKIALQCDDEVTLLQLAAHAKVVNLPFHVIRDAGRTQIVSGSRTVLGVGPAPKSLVDNVTGHLKLL